MILNEVQNYGTQYSHITMRNIIIRVSLGMFIVPKSNADFKYFIFCFLPLGQLLLLLLLVF